MEYNSCDKVLLWLNEIEGLGAKKKNELLKMCDSPIELWECWEDETVQKFIGTKIAERAKAIKSNEFVDNLIEKLNRYNINVITIYSEKYPLQLKEIACPPILLYCKGNTDCLSYNLLGVVGTRYPTYYGKDITATFVKELVHSGLAIVSGLAKGVDTIAHKTALEEGFITIAVIGCGLDKVYPAENLQLAKQIIEKGLIISEYPLGTDPHSFNFPERNRIISGLSKGILVTEAGEKSGSLITVNCALEQCREIFLVPGNINSKQSKGSNEVLKACQGAMALHPNDVLNGLNMLTREEKPNDIQLDFTEELIVNSLEEKGKLHFEEILALTNLAVSNLQHLLMKLELLGVVKKIGGNFYVL